MAIAKVLGAIPGIIVKPTQPQTHMMHVYLPGSPEALAAATLEIARRSHVGLARGYMTTELPGYSKFELSVGDAIEAISDDEIDQLFRQLLQIADTQR
jgi:hypothetical protein